MRFAFLIAAIVAGPVMPPWYWDSDPEIGYQWYFGMTYCTSPQGPRAAYWWERAEEILTKDLKTITSIIDVSKKVDSTQQGLQMTCLSLLVTLIKTYKL